MKIKQMLSGSSRQLLIGTVSIAMLFVTTAAIAETYTYDALGRLTSVTNDSSVTTYYCYDKAGNRTYIGPTPCP